MIRVMRGAASSLDMLDKVLATLAASLVLLVMGIVTTDVVLRYAFNAPLPWAFDLISLYLMAGIFFFLISNTYAVGGHVAVDIVQSRLSQASRHFCAAFSASLAACVFIVMTYVAWGRMLYSFHNNEVLPGYFDWPTWVAQAMVVTGGMMISARLVLSAVNHALSVATGEELAHLPTFENAKENAE